MEKTTTACNAKAIANQKNRDIQLSQHVATKMLDAIDWHTGEAKPKVANELFKGIYISAENAALMLPVKGGEIDPERAYHKNTLRAYVNGLDSAVQRFYDTKIPCDIEIAPTTFHDNLNILSHRADKAIDCIITNETEPTFTI